MKKAAAALAPTLALIALASISLLPVGCGKDEAADSKASPDEIANAARTEAAREQDHAKMEQGAPNAGAAATEGGGATGADATLIAAGKEVYAKQNCNTCHAINDEGGKNAPNLSKIGGEAEHTPDWLVAHIKNPKTHNPNSPMPPYEGKISDKDLLALGAYLASLK